MADKGNVDFDLNDKNLESVANVKIALRDSAKKAASVIGVFKINTRAADFNKHIYHRFLNFNKIARRVVGLGGVLSLPLSSSSSSSALLSTEQAKPIWSYSAVVQASSGLLHGPRWVKPLAQGDKAFLDKPTKFKPLKQEFFTSAVQKLNGLAAIARQSAMNIMLPQLFEKNETFISQPDILNSRTGAGPTEISLTRQSYLTNQQRFLTASGFKKAPEYKAGLVARPPILPLKPLVDWVPSRRIVEQSGKGFHENHMSVGQGEGDNSASKHSDGGLASSVVAALLAALTPELRTAGRGLEPMPVMIMNPEDIQHGSASYLTSQAGVQTGPTGFDYSLSLAHPSGVYL